MNAALLVVGILTHDGARFVFRLLRLRHVPGFERVLLLLFAVVLWLLLMQLLGSFLNDWYGRQAPVIWA